MSLMDDFEDRFRLGNPELDQTHREFVALLERLMPARGPEFADLFRQLFDHTAAHFANEDRLMVQSGFPAIAEHKADHERVLGDLTRMRGSLERGFAPLVRAYVRDQLPDWFRTHAATMDSALAGHLKNV